MLAVLMAFAPRARVTLVFAAVLAAAGAHACTLVLHEHRSGREVLRVALPEGGPPQLRLSFVHSVLGTAVQNRYRWQGGRWLLVEEQFEGEGYGLPHVAGPGERLERVAGGGTRLVLVRPVDPLVVRALAAQHMRLTLEDSRSWPLGELPGLDGRAVELRVEGC